MELRFGCCEPFVELHFVCSEEGMPMEWLSQKYMACLSTPRTLSSVWAFAEQLLLRVAEQLFCRLFWICLWKPLQSSCFVTVCGPLLSGQGYSSNAACVQHSQVGELFSFHVVLISKGMTTYDYIIAQREKQAFEEGGESGLSETLSTAKGVLKCMCCCKPSQVHDEGQAASRVSRPKVGLNPCAAMKASKPQGNPFTYGKQKGKPPADPDPDANLETHALESNGSYPQNVQMWAKATLDNESTSGANTPSRVSEHIGSPVSEQYVHGASASLGGVQAYPPLPSTISPPQLQRQQQQDIPATPQHWQPQLRQATPSVFPQQVADLSGPTYQQQQLGFLQQAIPLTQQQLQQTEQQLQLLLQQQQQQQQQPHLHHQAPSLVSPPPSINPQHPATYNNPFYQTHPPASPSHPPAPSSAHISLPTSPSQQRTQSVPLAKQVPHPPPGHTLPPIHLTSSRNAAGKRALTPIPATLLSGSDALHAAADASNKSDQGEVPTQNLWQGHGTTTNTGAMQGRGAGLAGYPQQGGLASAQPGAWSLLYPSYNPAPDDRTSYHYDAEMSSEVT
ncbi:hypothetical protein DUNSADRAFT_6003 [Dunaliella salina]|uniref:Uncharacterized protein n=1 Tax=Dunaliella salina TaxID=3046 RepID=A0ABQ7GP47_DUNSA|nr:hypothetical protein DUNSADRAFT_6003 [Dunaliella salina]|eukprot:KAF5836368.1 hypothetical protein DUNSADRAFT_6003 [Dunaliella salina]